MHEQETKLSGTNPEQLQQPPLLPEGPAFLMSHHHARFQDGGQILINISPVHIQFHSLIIQNKSLTNSTGVNASKLITYCRVHSLEQKQKPLAIIVSKTKNNY